MLSGVGGNRQAARAEVAASSVYARLGPLAIHGSEADVLSLGLGVFDLSKDRTRRPRRSSAGSGASCGSSDRGLVANTDGGVVSYGGVYMDVSAGPPVLTPLLGIAGAYEATAVIWAACSSFGRRAI